MRAHSSSLALGSDLLANGCVYVMQHVCSPLNGQELTRER